MSGAGEECGAGEPSEGASRRADREGEEAGFAEGECTGGGGRVGVGAKEPSDVFGEVAFAGGFIGVGVPEVGEDALEATAGNNGEAGVAFADDGLVDGADGRACADVERGAGEESEDFGGYVLDEFSLGSLR